MHIGRPQNVQNYLTPPGLPPCHLQKLAYFVPFVLFSWTRSPLPVRKSYVYVPLRVHVLKGSGMHPLGAGLQRNYDQLRGFIADGWQEDLARWWDASGDGVRVFNSKSEIAKGDARRKENKMTAEGNSPNQGSSFLMTRLMLYCCDSK